MRKWLGWVVLGGLFLTGTLLIVHGALVAHCRTEWVGWIDQDFATTAEADLKSMSTCRTVRIALVSPGGSAIWSYHVARLVRNASNAGQIIEIHGRSIVASGATFILAAGTPGHRYIAHDTLTLIHSIKKQAGWGEPPTCVAWTPKARTEEEIVDNTLIVLLARQYAEFTGHSVKQTLRWFACDAAFGGDGAALVVRGIADRLED